MSSTLTLVPDGQPTSWTRVEFNEERFVETCADDTDGVVLAQRFDTPHRLDSREARRGKTGSELKNAALRARIPFLLDIETWRLPYLSDREDESFGRDVHTMTAQAVPIPLTSESLADEATTHSLVRAAVSAQVGAARTFAPYFQFTSLDDPWLEVNLRCLVLTRGLLGDLAVAAWIYVSRDTMLSGVLPYVASRYAAVLPAGATVVLTVSDMQPDLDADQLASYFHALGAFARAGIPVIVDRCGEAAIPAVAAFAVGSMLGTRLYRTAPSSPQFTNEFNPRIPLRFFERRKGRLISREKALKWHKSGRLVRCAHPGCRAASTTRRKDNILVRLHNAHNIRYELRRTRRLGAPQLVWSWTNSRLKVHQLWAQALKLASARSEEA
jgi:hypothetical protein